MQHFFDDVNLNGKQILNAAAVQIKSGSENQFLATMGVPGYSTTQPIGYRTGTGGTVTQGTSKSTGVTLNAMNGDIVVNSALLGADTTVNFVFTNSFISAGDILILRQTANGAPGSYVFEAQTPSSGSANVYIRNVTAGGLAESFTLSFAVHKKVTS
jgi:hypothetical protein